MRLSVGDLQILYYLAVIGSMQSESNKDLSNKQAEIVEDAIRGEV